MAAYGALVSVMHIIKQIQNHPRPPISLDQKLAHSLIDNVTFLQHHLEKNSFVDNEEADALESRIADAAYAAEDIIESHIVDQIQVDGENLNSIDFYTSLQEVTEGLESIKRDVSKIKEKIQDQLLHTRRMPADVAASIGQSTTTVGLDDVVVEVMDKLTGQQSNRQIIPIVGMGGIGKTTLARNIYVNPVIMQYFDFRGWATISQEFNSKEILLEVLACLNITGSFGEMSEHELGDKLYKSLFGRRYLIVMDDIWSIEAWDEVKTFFPDNNDNDGSAILLTTRLSNLASQLSGSDDVLKMSFLGEDTSWNLFCTTVFGGEGGGCPLELEKIGKQVVKSCKGLPLSIAVIGGLLARHKQSLEYWENILENLNSILNSEDNEHCLRILRMSYKELPVHLKPCFLYMGAFPEDKVIGVSRLIKMWVAEGFLKPISGKSLEIAAEEYLRDLVDRNLVLVVDVGRTGEIEYCKIHDLLRDLCLKEASKDKFLCFKKAHELIRCPHDIQSQRRIGFQGSASKEDYGVSSQSASLRSLLCDFRGGPRYLPFLDFRLLRVLRAPDNAYFNFENYSMEQIFQPANLRYLEIVCNKIPEIPCYSVHHFWNLQTLVVRTRFEKGADAPVEIWKMPHLRHVMFDSLELPDPPTDDHHGLVILGNLQTLKRVKNFKCGEDVVKRIPNVKKLKIFYEDAGDYSLDNLCRLSKLESLSCTFRYDQGPSFTLPYLNFPRSLKELSLQGTSLQWEGAAMTDIGSLPYLQVLKLGANSFVGPEWVTAQGQFGRLKYLRIYDCHRLEDWRTESSHFPCLEQLVFTHVSRLKEIPSEIGDIPTLKSIWLHYCKRSVVISAESIRQEQEELGHVGLEVEVDVVLG